jgi:hypothetical protein
LMTRLGATRLSASELATNGPFDILKVVKPIVYGCRSNKNAGEGEWWKDCSSKCANSAFGVSPPPAFA